MSVLTDARASLTQKTNRISQVRCDGSLQKSTLCKNREVFQEGLAVRTTCTDVRRTITVCQVACETWQSDLWLMRIQLLRFPLAALSLALHMACRKWRTQNGAPYLARYNRPVITCILLYQLVRTAFCKDALYVANMVLGTNSCSSSQNTDRTDPC